MKMRAFDPYSVANLKTAGKPDNYGIFLYNTHIRYPQIAASEKNAAICTEEAAHAGDKS